jgi:p-aminobenzoyl-glutamate transporter AbgT
MAKMLPFCFGTLSLLFSIFFLVYGIRYGIIEKRILADFFDNYETGQEAVRRGVFYVIIGCFFFIGAIIIFVSMYLKGKATAHGLHF